MTNPSRCPCGIAIEKKDGFCGQCEKELLRKAYELVGVANVAALTAEVARLEQAVEEARREGRWQALFDATVEVAKMIERPHPRTEGEHVIAEQRLWDTLRAMRDSAAPAPSAQPCDHPQAYRYGSANVSGDVVETCGKCGKVLVDIHLDVKPVDVVARNASTRPPAVDVDGLAKLLEKLWADPEVVTFKEIARAAADFIAKGGRNA